MIRRLNRRSKMKKINRSIRPARPVPTSGRVRLDSHIKAVLPHEFKMTETKLKLSLSVSACLPLPLPLVQVPKGLYQATDWRDWGQSSRRTANAPTSAP